jgi:hypothetical protein
MNDAPFQQLSDLTIDVLRARAAELRTMAQTAKTADVRAALRRLADRFICRSLYLV